MQQTAKDQEAHTVPGIYCKNGGGGGFVRNMLNISCSEN